MLLTTEVVTTRTYMYYNISSIVNSGDQTKRSLIVISCVIVLCREYKNKQVNNNEVSITRQQ